MAYLMGNRSKATIVAWNALGHTFHLPDEDRYLHTREELIDWMKIRPPSAPRNSRLRAGHERRRQRPRRSVARPRHGLRVRHVEEVVSRCGRTTTPSPRRQAPARQGQALLTDGAYEEAIRLLEKHRPALDRVAGALLDRETLNRDDLESLLNVEPESRSSDQVGTIKVFRDPSTLN
jgi:hypothetical protein